MLNCVFEDALKRFGPKQRSALTKRLRILAAGSRAGNHIHQCLFSEARLPEKSAVAILRKLLVTPTDFSELKTEYKSACNREILQGPPMKGKRPKMLGRAVSDGRFKDMLIKHGVFASRNSAEAFFRMVRGLPLSTQKQQLKKIPLGKYVIWATFHSKNRTQDPFLKLPLDALQLQDALGFPIESRGDDLILFSYSPPVKVPLLFPTIADASWNDVFAPASRDPAMQHGLTRPAHEKDCLGCQPEVVHSDNVTCGCIRAPIRYIAVHTPSI
jgi:hypothetical protein